MSSQASDLTWLRDLAGDLGRLGSKAHVVAASVDLVARRFGSDIATYSHLVRGTTVHTPMRDIDRVVDLVRARIEQHPLYEPLVSGSRLGPAAPVVLSEVITARRWQTHPIYTEVLEPHGVPLHTVCIPVVDNAGGQLEWYQLNRDRDFSPGEVDLFARLQPVLIALVNRPPSGPRPPTSPLTARETELLRHLAAGLTVPAAARRLGMASGTARKHVENIHRKLDTHGPVTTVRRAIELGLIDPEGR